MKHHNQNKTQNKSLIDRLDKIELLQFLIGIIAIFFLVYYYLRTLIDIWILVVLVLGIGVIFSFVTLRYYKTSLKGDFNLRKHIVISILFYGFTIPAILLSLNYYLTVNKIQTIQRLLIVKEGYHRYGSGLYAETTINGSETRLITLPQEVTASNDPKLFSIKIVKGCFGFTVIKNISIIN